MSKVIGITPGPVEFTNLDNEDLATIKQFNPSNTGSTGQVLTKTANGYDWETANGMTDNAMLGFYSSFECETEDNYQGGVPINPDSTQAGSIYVSIPYILQTLDSENNVVGGSTGSFCVTLSNNNGNIGGQFCGTASASVSPSIPQATHPYYFLINFEVALNPQNQEGTIIFNTTVVDYILAQYGATNDGAYKFRVVAGATAPTILSGCANATY